MIELTHFSHEIKHLLKTTRWITKINKHLLRLEADDSLDYDLGIQYKNSDTSLNHRVISYSLLLQKSSDL